MLKIFFCFHIFFTHFSLNLNNIESFLFSFGFWWWATRILHKYCWLVLLFKFFRPSSIKQIFLIAVWPLSFVFLSSKNDTMWQQKRTLKVCLFSLLSNSIQYVSLFFLLNSVVLFVCFLKDVIIQEPSYISSFFLFKEVYLGGVGDYLEPLISFFLSFCLLDGSFGMELISSNKLVDWKN